MNDILKEMQPLFDEVEAMRIQREKEKEKERKMYQVSVKEVARKLG